MSQFIEILKTIVLGVIEGITEWLPISSTGHLIIAEKLMNFGTNATEFKEMFDVVIQLGAILAVVVIYFSKLWPFCGDKSQNYIKKDSINLWLKVLVGVLPAGIIGLLFDDEIDALFYDNAYIIAATLIIYGILFIIVERFNKKRIPKTDSVADLSYKTALFIGCFQVLAMIPGTSRSGITILAAILLGLSRNAAAEYSFFMSVPVMVGAGGLKALKYVLKLSDPTAAVRTDNFQWVVLAVGLIVSFLVSVLAIKFLISYIKKNDFSAFGYYRIIIGIVVLVYFSLV